MGKKLSAEGDRGLSNHPIRGRTTRRRKYLEREKVLREDGGREKKG